MAKRNLLWGIDLGGSKVEAIAVYADEIDKPLCRVRIESKMQLGYPALIGQLTILSNKLKEQVQLAPLAVGIGMPGIINPKSGSIRNSSAPYLNDHNLASELTLLFQAPTSICNDANCFALAEASLGAGQGAKLVFGAIIGTGVGGGFVLNGEILAGHHGITGEWGHMAVVQNGLPCGCGRSGCIEQYICGPALQSIYHQLTGNALPLAQIAQRAEQGDDPAARETIDHLCYYFGKGLANIVNIIDPDVIVLGGGVSNVAALYTKGVAELKRRLFVQKFETEILANKLGDSSGVFGAAILARRSLSY